MTRDEFNKQEWGAGMQCVFKDNNKQYPILGVDFYYDTVMIEADWWVSYLDINLITKEA